MSPAAKLAEVKPADVKNDKPAGVTTDAAKEQVTPQAQPVLCGVPVPYRGSTKPCVKPLGPDGKHTGDHSTRINKPAATTFDWSKFDAEKLKPQTFAPDEELEIVSEPGDRSDVQKLVDAQVKEALDAWRVSTGKPKAWSAAIKAGVVRRYFLDPKDADAYRSLLRAAEKMLGVKIHIAPVQKHKSGEHMLPWFVVDKRAAATAAVSAGTGNTGTENSGK